MGSLTRNSYSICTLMAQIFRIPSFMVLPLGDMLHDLTFPFSSMGNVGKIRHGKLNVLHTVSWALCQEFSHFVILILITTLSYYQTLLEN